MDKNMTPTEALRGLVEAVEAYRYARDDLSGAPPAVRADEAMKRYPAMIAALTTAQAALGAGHVCGSSDSNEPCIVPGHAEWLVSKRWTWQVHNHGPSEGRGLQCPERLVGECRLSVLEQANADLRARLAAGERERDEMQQACVNEGHRAQREWDRAHALATALAEALKDGFEGIRSVNKAMGWIVLSVPGDYLAKMQAALDTTRREEGRGK